MTPAEIEAISAAACLLDGMALDLRCAHNVDWQNPTWSGEESAKQLHDQAKGTSAALLAMLEGKGMEDGAAPVFYDHLDEVNAAIDAQEMGRGGT